MSGLVAAFDTHAFVKRMVATGFTEAQAETQVQLLTDILGYQLSTKADVAKMDAHVLEVQRDIKALDARIETTRAELMREIETTRSELTREIETTRSELTREIKELDTKIETTRAELTREIKELDTKIETSRAELKREIETSRAELKRDIKELDTKIEITRAELKRDIKELELRMVIKMGAMILGGIGLLFGLMRVWPLPVQYVAPSVQEMRLPALPSTR
ncbi:MAG: hypothetical protein HQM01_13195 [Magnetococcales bacterium]|nr:hypothetical protein [Magnetococcales bacterium]